MHFLLLTVLPAALLATSDCTVRDSTVTLPLDQFEKIFTEARLTSAEFEHKARLRNLEQDYDERDRILQQRRTELESDASGKIDAQAAQAALHAKGALTSLFPSNHQLLGQSVNGSFNVTASLAFIDADIASFDVSSTLRILADEWTVVPLANASSIVASDWRLEWRPEACDTLDGGGGTGSGLAWLPVDVVSDARSMLLLRGEQHVLATNRSGLYRVSFAAHARVRRARHLKELGLSLHYKVAQVSLRLVGAGTINELSMTPAAAVVRMEAAEGDPTTTVLHATMPPTQSVAFKWHDAGGHAAPRPRPPAEAAAAGPGAAAAAGVDAAAAKEPEPPAKPQVTAAHDALVSISEGLVQTTHQLVLTSTADSSPLSTVEVLIWDHATRITSVVASGLEAWHVAPVSAAELLTRRDANGSAAEVVASRLRATFRSSHLEPTTTLMVFTEMEVDMAEGGFAVPVLECAGVLRQTGRVGLATVASVQVDARRVFGLATADPAELASQLRLNTDRPIVLAYKYLSTRHDLRVGVTQHEQLGVLDAAVDRMHYAAAVVDTHVMHTVDLAMQHTKQQYLALHGLPPTAHMFSVSVDGEAVKPVAGGAPGDLLVPLLGAGRRYDDDNDGSSHKLLLSLSYLSRHAVDPPDPARNLTGDARNGSFSLALPRLELPVSVLSAELRLPEQHEYNFSSALGDDVDELDYEIPRAASDPRPSRPEEGERLQRKKAAKGVATRDGAQGGGGAHKAKGGRRPPNENGPPGVRVNLPSKIGRLFWFQRLLVVDAALAINVTYFEPLPVEEEAPVPPRKAWKLW